MGNKYLTFLLALVFLGGCYDEFYGPTIQNALSKDVEINILYGDGSTAIFTAPPNRPFLIGDSGISEDGIVEVVISSEGKELHKLRQEDVRALTEIQRKIKARSILCIGASDVYVFEPDPSGAGDCTAGKRVDL